MASSEVARHLLFQSHMATKTTCMSSQGSDDEQIVSKHYTSDCQSRYGF
ncbi:SEPT10 isoform 7 [Pan troglodytes]|uniref:Septin 10 n=2 Tax=Homininae TaxID=207598 RepID=F8WC85_HUMAN|nr:SEPT10 isoform 7 [Pan troglodytes]